MHLPKYSLHHNVESEDADYLRFEMIRSYSYVLRQVRNKKIVSERGKILNFDFESTHVSLPLQIYNYHWSNGLTNFFCHLYYITSYITWKIGYFLHIMYL